MSDDKPSSFGEALEAAGVSESDIGSDQATPDAATSADGSSPSSDTLSPSDAASTAASPTETPQSPEPPPGPLPYERHKAILDKAYAERDTLKAQMEALSWAQQVPADVAPRLVEMARRVQGDPVGFLVELATEVQNDPRHAAALRSHAAKVLGQRASAPQQAPADEEPGPDIVVDGHKWYSGEQQAKREAWLTRKLVSELGSVIDERVAPVATLAQRVADAERQQETTKAANAFAATEFEKVSKLPGFLEHRQAIGEAFSAEMAKIPLEQQDQLAPVVLRDVYHSVVLPTLAKTSAESVAKTLTAKAVKGSLGAQPTVAATSSRPRSMADALAQAGI